ncbi:MAG: NYN domain-containing protein [Cyanobacteria bacterium P01_D01_bin.50]
MTVTLTKHPTALLNKIGSYVCQAVIYIQQQQPELLIEKYRNISWRENSNQSLLKAKLIEVVNNAQDWESLVNQVEVFIKVLLISDSTDAPVLIKLQEKIRQLNPHISESNDSSDKQDINSIHAESNIQTVDGSTSHHQQSKIKTAGLNDDENQQERKSTESAEQESLLSKNELNDSEKESLPTTTEPKSSENQQNINSIEQEIPYKSKNQENTGIAVLLLDVENIQIQPETEQFLTTVCTNPIQIKIAFANWQSMGKKDIELHQRGYDLIHVPRGKDNADGKMMAFGSTINEYYPQVKEVLVYSSDKVMTNLCNHLQQKGLIVYQISQQNSNLTIFNGKTNEIETHTILPSIEQLLYQIKDIIKEQEAQTSNQWIKLSKICTLFKEKYSFGINKVVSHHLPDKTVKNIFVNKSEFVIHQIPEHPEVYVTLFKMPTSKKVETKILTFENKSDVEKEIIKIITHLVGKNPLNYIPISTVGERFNKQYGKGISHTLREVSTNGNFVKFLQSCNSFELKKTGNIWQVAIQQSVTNIHP